MALPVVNKKAHAMKTIITTLLLSLALQACNDPNATYMDTAIASTPTTPTANPAPTLNSFNGKGSAPDWELTFEHEADNKYHYTFATDYNDQSVGRLELTPIVNDGVFSLIGKGKDHKAIRVLIREEACTDENNQSHTHSVHVTWEGRQLHGCGTAITYTATQ